jgi:hypothetical protein
MKLKDIFESIYNHTLTVYHGTSPSKALKIKTQGLKDSSGNYSSDWFMLSTDMESALYHARIEEEGGDVAVVEFKIEIDPEEIWEGFPYLWKPYDRSSKSSWYGIRTDIPAKFVKTIHNFSNVEWKKQKNIGY